jgi:hypothetical protein
MTIVWYSQSCLGGLHALTTVSPGDSSCVVYRMRPVYDSGLLLAIKGRTAIVAGIGGVVGVCEGEVGPVE